MTEASWRHMHALLRELALYGLLVTIVVLAVPFSAGYVLDRARRAGHVDSASQPL